MTRSTLILLAASGSAALLLGALGFQYIGDMPPCKLCYWQRYGHLGALAAGAAALFMAGALLPLIGALSALSSAGIGAYHTGVERGWWEGPSTCTSGSISGLSTEDLLNQIMAAPLVRCDEVPWEFLSLSMASWNMLASVLIAAIWVMAAKARG